MNYSLLFKNFRDELFDAVQYKQLESNYKFFAVIATLPFWIAYLSVLVSKYICLFLFNCFASSADYLELWVKDTKKGVQPITEAVLYLVAMPVIFFIRCMLSIFSVIFYLLWFSAMLSGYICSLGGIKWQPFISSAKYKSVFMVKTNRSSARSVIALGAILFVAYVAFYIIALVNETDDLLNVASVISSIYSVFIWIAVPSTFKKTVLKCEGSDSDSDASIDLGGNYGKISADDEFEEDFPDF
jgi:hypothetical protein